MCFLMENKNVFPPYAYLTYFRASFSLMKQRLQSLFIFTEKAFDFASCVGILSLCITSHLKQFKNFYNEKIPVFYNKKFQTLFGSTKYSTRYYSN